MSCPPVVSSFNLSSFRGWYSGEVYQAVAISELGKRKIAAQVASNFPSSTCGDGVPAIRMEVVTAAQPTLIFIIVTCDHFATVFHQSRNCELSVTNRHFLHVFDLGLNQNVSGLCIGHRQQRLFIDFAEFSFSNDLNSCVSGVGYRVCQRLVIASPQGVIAGKSAVIPGLISRNHPLKDFLPSPCF